jgi:hypothetical protein
MDEQLREDIGFWLPYIVIDDLIIQPNYDRNYVGIELKFRVTVQGSNQQIIMFVDSAGSATIQ